MNKVLFALQLLLGFSALLSSCDKESSNDTPKSKEYSLLLGEWKLEKTEGYLREGTFVKGHPGKTGAYLVFKSNGEYLNQYYSTFNNYKGTFKLKNNTLTLNVEFLNTHKETESYTDVCSIIELTDDNLVFKEPYEDSEYDYELKYFSRIRAYNQNFKLSEEGKRIVGVWKIANMDNNNYWCFSEEGFVYIASTMEAGPLNNRVVQTWNYDDDSRILTTTVTWSNLSKLENYTYGNFTYAWKLLNISNDSMSGQALFGKEQVYTFKRI